MELTPQQKTIIDTIKDDSCHLLKINAVAGAGKTSTLVSISETLDIKHGLYLAFNKAIADEAKTKFPNTIECRTLHSLAYAFIVAGTDRKLQELTIDDIVEPTLRPKERFEVIQLLNEFFSSASLDIEEFLADNSLLPFCYKYLHLMEDAKMNSTFGFILKRFQVLVHLNMLKLPHYDLLMLDEAGDTTGCSLDLFNHIPATKKVMVGDVAQNINSFMHTINGFEEMSDVGIELPLTQSFRVSKEIAKEVEVFAKKYINKKMSFEGIPIKDKTITTMAYLSRTNAQLVDRMIDLHASRTTYTLLRPLISIFALPLAIANINNPNWKPSAEFIHLSAAAERYDDSPELQLRYKSKLGYIKAYFAHDIQIQSAITLVLKHTSKKVIETYFTAKVMNKPRQKVTLSTAHTSKGYEFDCVYIEGDLNYSVEKSIDVEDEDLSIIYLYYTACTRAKKQLINATGLKYVKGSRKIDFEIFDADPKIHY